MAVSSEPGHRFGERCGSPGHARPVGVAWCRTGLRDLGPWQPPPPDGARSGWGSRTPALRATPSPWARRAGRAAVPDITNADEHGRSHRVGTARSPPAWAPARPELRPMHEWSPMAIGGLRFGPG